MHLKAAVRDLNIGVEKKGSTTICTGSGDLKA